MGYLSLKSSILIMAGPKYFCLMSLWHIIDWRVVGPHHFVCLVNEPLSGIFNRYRPHYAWCNVYFFSHWNLNIHLANGDSIVWREIFFLKITCSKPKVSCEEKMSHEYFYKKKLKDMNKGFDKFLKICQISNLYQEGHMQSNIWGADR